MTLNKLASEIAKLQGRRSQAYIKETSELLGIVGELLWKELIDIEDLEKRKATCALYDEGRSRVKRKARRGVK